MANRLTDKTVALPVYGERVASRISGEPGEGAFVAQTEPAPHPTFALRSKADLSPRSGER